MATAAIHSLQHKTLYPVPESTGAFIDVCSLDDFQLGEEIGSGSFGTVVKAKHVKYNDVAIKILRCEDSRTEAVRKEATKMRRLCAYPSIICVHCVVSCSDQNRVGIVMEWMKLGNLKDFQQKRIKEFPWALRMRMLKEISEGMYYLHDEDIIHRDLKAENIFMQETLSVKIGDFGLSKSMQTLNNCKLGGTPSHMPPEYFDKNGSPNKLWDVYSFGILLYEVASGKTVFEEIGDDVDRLMFCVVKNNDRPDISDSYPTIVKELMKKCWDATPTNRPNFKEIKLAIRKDYEENYEISILKATIEVLTHLQDQQCMTARTSNLQTRGRQTENQRGSSELVTANEANQKTATMNQMSDEQNDKFIQTASYVNTAVSQSTGRLVHANSSTDAESHREIMITDEQYNHEDYVVQELSGTAGSSHGGNRPNNYSEMDGKSLANIIQKATTTTTTYYWEDKDLTANDLTKVVQSGEVIRWTRLILSGIDLSSIKGKTLADLLHISPDLEFIEMINCKLSGSIISEMVFECHEKHIQLTNIKFFLKENNLSTIDGKALVKLIEIYPLNGFRFTDYSLTSKNLEDIVMSGDKDKLDKLEVLDLSGVALTSISEENLADLFVLCPKLTNVNMSTCQLSGKIVQNLLYICKTKGVELKDKELNLKDNDLSDINGVYLVQLVRLLHKNSISWSDYFLTAENLTKMVSSLNEQNILDRVNINFQGVDLALIHAETFAKLFKFSKHPGSIILHNCNLLGNIINEFEDECKKLGVVYNSSMFQM